MPAEILKIENEILSLLEFLPKVIIANHDEILNFITIEKLYGIGLGYIDIHLLASALLSNCKILTRDKKLAKAAHKFEVDFKI